MTRTCHCLISDWRALRAALGLTQAEMARLAATSPRTIQRAEAAPHVCIHHASQVMVRAQCDEPYWRERLERAGYVWEQTAA